MPATLGKPDAALRDRAHELLKSPLYQFKPRVDIPAEYDQQTGYVNSRAKVSFCRAGNGAGKTLCSAVKLVRFVTQERCAPRWDTPFMIVSDTYEQVANICWKEKILPLLPPDIVDWNRCQWQNKNRNLPYVIALKPWSNNPDTCWNLEFRSLDQGRRHFQGRSFGGFWFSEQFEWEIFDEVVRGCRDTWYDGAHFAEFTPIDPDLAVGYEERMEDPPPGWAEYRMNVYKNVHVSADWRESFLASVSDELRPTRETGEMLSLAGAIYRSWNPAVHVLDDEQWKAITGKHPPERYCTKEEFKRDTPQNVFFRRAIDWGESHEHPFVTLWGMKNGSGDWFIYDEYCEATGLVLYEDRINEIKDRWPWIEHDPHYGMTYADPSRPLLISDFSAHGIVTCGASNNVHAGIEYVRSLVKVNKITGRPRLFILKKNCPRLAKGMRKYRWLRSYKPGVSVDRRMNPAAAKMEPLKYQDDEVDACRYLLYSDRQREGAPPSSVSTADPNPGRRYGVHVNGRYNQGTK